jgi:hypothetical protein
MLTRDHFAELLNGKFDFLAEDGRKAELVLEEVSELKQSRYSEHFSLLFRGPLETPLGQGIHQLSREGAENMEMFIVPVGRDDKGYLYESIFNWLVPAENVSADTSQ